MEIFRLFGTISINKAEAMADLSAVSAAASTSSGKISSAFREIGDKAGEFIKRGAMVAVAGLTAAMGLGVKAAADYEQSMVELAKVTDPDTAGSVGYAIREMAKDMPLTHEALMGIAVQAGRLGVEGADNITAFTKTIAQVSVATDIMAEDAGTAFAKLITLTGDSITEIDGMGSAINELSNNMAVSSSEIVDAALRSAGALEGLGATTPEILGLNAAMNEVVFSARLAGTALKTVALALQNPEKMVALADALGVTVEEFRNLRETDPVELFKQLALRMTEGGEPAEELVGILGDSANTLAILGQNWDGVEEAIASANIQMEEATSLQREYDLASESFNAKMTVLKNNFHDIGIDIGTALLPSLEDFVAYLKSNKDEIGDALVGIADGIVTTFGWIIDNKEGVITAIIAIGAALATMATINLIKNLDATQIALMAIVATGAGIGAVAQYFADIREDTAKARVQVEEMRDSMESFNLRMEESARLADDTSEALGDLRQAAQDLIDTNKELVDDGSTTEWSKDSRDEFSELAVVIQNVKDRITEIGVESGLSERAFSDLEAAMMLTFNAMQETPGTGLETFRIEATKVLETLGDIDPRLKALIVMLGEDVPEAADDAAEATEDVKDGIGKIVGEMKDGKPEFTDFGETLMDLVEGAFTDFSQGLINMRDQYKDHQEALSELKDAEIDRLAELADGRDADLQNLQESLDQGLISQEQYTKDATKVLEKYEEAVTATSENTKKALADEKEAYEDAKITITSILKELLHDTVVALRNELIAKAAAALAEAIGLSFISPALAAPKYAQAGALSVGAATLLALGFEEGAVFDEPTMLPAHMVAEGGAPEAYLPLTRNVLGQIGQGIVNAITPQQPVLSGVGGGNISIDMRGMYDGATLNIRSESDIELMAQEHYSLFKSRLRSEGVRQ